MLAMTLYNLCSWDVLNLGERIVYGSLGWNMGDGAFITTA